MNITSTTRSAVFALLGIMALLSPPATAQQAESRQTESPGATQDEESSTDTAAEPVTADGEDNDADTEVFIPSEEISEDFAVSFPVDI